jgi:uncharacterized protein (TIGR02145 family)
MKTTRIQQITLLLLFALADLSAQSVVVNPHIRATFEKIVVYTPDESGNYRLSGKTCFDVKRINYNTTCGVETARKNDFASGYVFTYTFSSPSGSAYSNLIFKVDDPDGLLTSYTSSGSDLNLTFISTINAKTAGTTKANPYSLTITAQYTDNTGTDKQISLEIKVQDCICSCRVKSTLAAGWLTFLCYNLGADPNKSIEEQMAYMPNPSGTGSTDATVYGELYQWGRKADGHQKRNSTAVDGGSTAVTISYTSDGQIPTGHAWYGNHVYFTGGIYDWHGNSATNKNDSLWNGTVSGNNPCPSGWRVPTRNEWYSIFNGNATSTTTGGNYLSSSGNRWTWNSSGTLGYKISPDGGTTYTLFLPAAGLRHYDSSTLDNVGVTSYYWSSTPISNYSYGLGFNSNNVNPGNDYIFRDYGFSVRCVAE